MATHGYLSQYFQWRDPRVVVECNATARPDQKENSCAAHEYSDLKEVFHEKVDLLVRMMLSSKKMVAYTGAGISTSAGIGDYASRTAGKSSQVAALVRQKMNNGFEARPTLAHLFLVRLYQTGVLKYWIQQNHDGLPQKAGLPQHAINEIHGAWFDPANRVVQFNENLRDDLFADLLHWEQNADLCLALGTSLSGMNADRVAETCGTSALSMHRKLMKKAKKLETKVDVAEAALTGGLVIIGFQSTRLDEVAALRIYAPIDDVFHHIEKILCQIFIDNESIPTQMVFQNTNIFQQPLVDDLHYWKKYLYGADLIDYRNKTESFAVKDFPAGRIIAPHVYELHRYDKNGLRLRSQAANRLIILNLQRGAKVRITTGIDAGSEGVVDRVLRDTTGEYILNIRCLHYDRKQKTRYHLNVNRRLGLWMIASLLEGQLAYMPVVNTE